MSQFANAARTDHSSATQGRSERERGTQPWSHRQNWPMRLLITVLAAVAGTVIATVAQRMGATANIPYGLVLAWLLVGLSAWCARSRMGGVGLAFHLIASSAAAYLLASRGSLGDALVPLFTSSASIPYFSRYVTWYWLVGMIALQVIMLALPARWFRMDNRN